MLSSLQQLTYLCVTDCSECLFNPAELKHLTALTGLRHLGLGDSRESGRLPPLAGPLDWLLPLTQLTALELTQHKCSIPAPGFQALPKLQRLCLSRSRIDPAALAAVSGLQHLRLYDCDLPPRRRSQFFSWLQLQPLTHLSIQYCKGLDIRDARALEQACAAVTASTALRELHFPWLCLQLTVERQLLQLTALTCSCSSDNAKQLVRCCPAVKRLDLVHLGAARTAAAAGRPYLSFLPAA